jgi:hypothetical protein
MKTSLVILFLVFITANLYANKNWIAIEPLNQETPKQNPKLDGNLSQTESITKIIKLIDGTEKEKPSTENDKNWYILKPMEKK